MLPRPATNACCKLPLVLPLHFIEIKAKRTRNIKGIQPPIKNCEVLIGHTHVMALPMIEIFVIIFFLFSCLHFSFSRCSLFSIVGTPRPPLFISASFNNAFYRIFDIAAYIVMPFGRRLSDWLLHAYFTISALSPKSILFDGFSVLASLSCHYRESSLAHFY